MSVPARILGSWDSFSSRGDGAGSAGAAKIRRPDTSRATAVPATPTASEAAAAEAEPPQPLRLTSRAWRLDAFACRSCGLKTRNMVEYPKLFLRCEPCAALDRWPAVWTGRIPQG